MVIEINFDNNSYLNMNDIAGVKLRSTKPVFEDEYSQKRCYGITNFNI